MPTASHSEDERDRAFEVDRTPGPVALQGLNALFDHHRRHLPRSGCRVLDPCAGSGVFAQQFRISRWMRHGGFRIEGVDVRPEEHPHMLRHCCQSTVSDARTFLALQRPDAYGLIMANPAFSLLTPKGGISLLDDAMRVTFPGGLIMMLGLNDLGIRGKASRELFERHTPIRQMRIAGALRFRNGINPKNGKKWSTDMRSYSWWVWQKGYQGRSWEVENLPLLPVENRRWETIPGREP